MKDSANDIFLCVFLFCASTALHLRLEHRRSEEEPSPSAAERRTETDEDGSSFRPRRFDRKDSNSLCNPLNYVPPTKGPRRSYPNLKPSLFAKESHGNGGDGTIWNHFECFDEGRDDGHRIVNSLSGNLLDHCAADDDEGDEEEEEIDRSGRKRPPRRSSSTWDYAMTMTPDGGFDGNGPHELSNGGNAKHCFMPNKLILVRHGQSEGNVNEQVYASKPDNSLNLTRFGWDQAKMAGKALRESIIGKHETIHFIVSPYVRTMESLHGILSAWCDPAQFNHIHDKDDRLLAWYAELQKFGISWSEDPRIREQDFGNYQDPATIKRAKKERIKFGTFYYRFPYGESASDVFDRVSTFLDSLWRSFQARRSTNYVIVTHGISIRVFLARYFRYTVDQFNMLENPKNGELVVLSHDGHGKLELSGRSQLEQHVDPVSGHRTNKLIGYTFHKKLRCYAIKRVRRRQVKLSFDE